MTDTFDDEPAAGFRISDLRIGLVREFLHDVRSPLLAEPDTRAVYRALQLVTRINSQEVPRNVGLLCFSESPEKIFPGAGLHVTLFRDSAGTTELLGEHIGRGPLLHQLRTCLCFLRNQITHTIRKHPDRPEATTWYDYPIAAVEEVVANAVHHRDYRADQPIKVYLYPDEMVITSYPGPVPGIKLEHFAPGKRIPQAPARNRRIGELLKELRLAEVRSTGIPKIFGAMEANGSPPPRFEFDEDRTFFTVVLPIHPESRPGKPSPPGPLSRPTPQHPPGEGEGR